MTGCHGEINQDALFPGRTTKQLTFYQNYCNLSKRNCLKSRNRRRQQRAVNTEISHHFGKEKL
jgi:hypothetical protein